MGVWVGEERVVEMGNSISVGRAISGSELFRIISGLKFFCLFLLHESFFSLFISNLSLFVSLHVGVLTIHWIRTKSVHRTPSR